MKVRWGRIVGAATLMMAVVFALRYGGAVAELVKSGPDTVYFERPEDRLTRLAAFGVLLVWSVVMLRIWVDRSRKG